MSATPNAGSENVLNSDVEIKGNLKFAGELTFAGKLEGEIRSEGALQLGDQSVVCGNLHLHSVVLRGKVNGNVSAREKVEIKSKGELFGDVRASKLVIEEGATFVGKCEVNPNKASPAALPGAAGATKPPDSVIVARKLGTQHEYSRQ